MDTALEDQPVEEQRPEALESSEAQELGKIELKDNFTELSEKLKSIWYKYHDLGREGSVESVRPVDHETYGQLYSLVENLQKELEIDIERDVRFEQQPNATRKAVGPVEARLKLNLSHVIGSIKASLSEIQTYQDFFRDSKLRDNVTRLHGIAEFWIGVN